MRIATPAFFCFPFAWSMFFHPLTYSLYASWGLKCVSYKQHIYGSCFCIHSASLCLLAGAFNPFTFKVIIHIYVPIAIFLIVWGWCCRSFSSLAFLDYIWPFNICCKAGLLVLNSLNFFLSENLFISPSILNEILAGDSDLGCLEVSETILSSFHSFFTLFCPSEVIFTILSSSSLICPSASVILLLIPPRVF